MVLLHHFNLEKMTCQLYLYDVGRPLEKRKPVHQGKISFTHDKQKLRPFRYEEKMGRSYKYLKARDVIDLMSKVSILVTLKEARPSNLNEYLEFLKFANAPKPKVLMVCQLCLRNGMELTKLDAETRFDSHGKSSCRSCARDEIKSEYIKRGIPITISARKFYNSQLDRLRSVSQVIESLWESSKLVHDKSSTLFDVISADKSNAPRPISQFFSKYKSSIDIELVNHWKKLGISKLMPVQMKSIENGLLNKQDLLVVAGTSSGKTMVGEIAGLQNWRSRNEVFVFVTPLVALTNQKYDSFKKRYRKLGARVAIRVGKSRIMDDELDAEHTDGNIAKADIIVATYEALDWLFRSGRWRKISNIGTLVIDEFQLLADEERGVEVDGLLSRIRTLYPKCQVIALSATIGNEKELAKLMNLKLVSYMNRPIPLERHLIIADKEDTKIEILEDYVREEAAIRSTSGYRGQTLIFTNTRRRVQEIGNSLKTGGIRSSYYHAGMTYKQRRIVEKQFEGGKLDVLTTTAALGAGADFPVSQVIFERPAMGAKWLTIAEYHQMAGRAGRLGYHDSGKAIMIATVGEKIYKAQERTEEQVAFDILTGNVEEIDGEVEYENELDQILAFISAAYPLDDDTLRRYYSTLFYRTNQLPAIIKSLSGYGMIAHKETKWYITPLGRAVSSSFLKPSFGYDIARKTKKHSIYEIAVEIAPLEAIHLTSRMQGKIEQALKSHISSRFFSPAVLESITDLSATRGRISKFLLDQIRFWQREFFDCSCRTNPYCKHPVFKVSLLVLNLRMEGMSIKQMTNHLSKHYDLMIYHGDLLNWLDSVVHAINAIGRLAKAMKMEDVLRETSSISIRIEAPAINFDLNKKMINKEKPNLRRKPRHLERKPKKQHRGRRS